MHQLENGHLTVQGLHVKRSCPFCGGGQTKQSVLNITLETKGDYSSGVWYCFACNRGGGVHNGWLLEKGEKPPGGWPKRSAKEIEQLKAQIEKRETKVDIPNEYAQILADVFELYVQNFPGSNGELYFTNERGLKLVEGVKIGYSPGGKFLLSQGFDEQKLIDLGLIWVNEDPKKHGGDKMAGRIILPYHWNGKITCFHGRAITPKPKLKHYYTHTTVGDISWRKGIYNEAALNSKNVMPVEGALDVIAALILNYQNVCALGGVYNEDVFERIQESNADVTLGLDNDVPGDKGAATWIEKLGEERTSRIYPPNFAKDWNEVLMRPLVIKRYDSVPKEYAETLALAFKAYKKAYRNSPGQLHMQEYRGVVNDSLGYSPGGKYLLSQGLDKNILLELGLIDEQGVDTMAEKVVYPYTWNNKVTSLGAIGCEPSMPLRTVHSKNKTAKGSWIKGVFNEPALKNGVVTFTSSALDAMCAQRIKGMENVCSSEGSPSDVIQKVIPGAAKVILAFNTDERGKKKAEAWSAELEERLREERLVRKEPLRGHPSWHKALEKLAALARQKQIKSGPIAIGDKKEDFLVSDSPAVEG